MNVSICQTIAAKFFALLYSVDATILVKESENQTIISEGGIHCSENADEFCSSDIMTDDNIAEIRIYTSVDIDACNVSGDTAELDIDTNIETNALTYTDYTIWIDTCISMLKSSQIPVFFVCLIL